MAETYLLNPRDAIHCASAITKGLNVIVSDGADFDAVKEIKRIAIARV